MDHKHGPQFLQLMNWDYNSIEVVLSIAESNIIRKNVLIPLKASFEHPKWPFGFKRLLPLQIYNFSMKTKENESWSANKIGTEFKGVHYYVSKFYTSIKLPALPKASSADQNIVVYSNILSCIFNFGVNETGFQKEMLIVLGAFMIFESKRGSLT